MWIADPKAINHILQKSGYLYAKPRNVQEQTALLADRGVVWAEGESPSSFMRNTFSLLAHRTITQATYTSVIGGRWLQHLASSMLKVFYRAS